MATKGPHSSEAKKAYNRAWYQRNKEKQLAYLKKYQQEHREELRAYQKKRYLAETEEARQRRLERLREKYANDPAMRERIQAAAKRWRSENREEIRQQARLSSAVRERRERQNGGTLPSDIRERLRVSQQNRCALCGEVMDATELDHIVAVVNGGKNRANNVQLVHPLCNKRKGIS